MRVLCLPSPSLSRLSQLGVPLKDLTPAGFGGTSFHIVTASPEQAKALKELKIEYEDITPRSAAQAASTDDGFLYCRGGKIPNGTLLRTKYKGKGVEGEVRGGVIWIDGKAYDTPSFAARAVGHGSVNGWRVWEYLNARGQWRPLAELRDS